MKKAQGNSARRAVSILILLALLVGTVVPTFAQTRRPRLRRGTRTTRTTPPRPTFYTVPADTVIRVRMNEEMSSKTARVGDRFSTNVTEPVYGGSSGVEVIPVGSRVFGRVTSVTRAGRRSPGNIAVSFNQVQLPNGVRYAINGSLASLQADDVNSDNEGTVSGRSNRRRDAVFIGGGAAAGALIGAIAGGGRGAGIGAIIGGGLGTAGRVFEREREAEVKSGTEFGVILNRSVSLPRSTR
ncbi:MAG TPA: hypothetical protein VFX96_13055 [Pyrinomonadaceae bacterium]|nr:hypothetical protein [Pyrinomonadaceae bacterium]